MSRTGLVASLVLSVLCAGPVRAAEQEYVIDTRASRVLVQVGKSGLFKFAGHEHEVEAPLRDGRILADPEDATHASLHFAVATAALRVTGRGEPPDDVAEVQARMLGPDVLDASRYPEIVFRSSVASAKALGAGAYDVSVVGELTLHGSTRQVTLPARVKLAGDTLEATGVIDLRQTDYGIRPVSVAGVVKVKNELRIEWTVVARAPQPATDAAVPRP